MSNGNTTLEHSPASHTATVGIFSPSMSETLLVCNERIGALVPAGGKWKPTDVNIYHTGLRELWEEVGIDIPVTPGDWIDINGQMADYQKIVRVYPFRIGPQNMIDHLFLYRLRGEYDRTYIAEKKGKWYSKKDLQPETITIENRIYRLLVPGTREAILDVMSDTV